MRLPLSRGSGLFAFHLYDFADGLEGSFVAEIAQQDGVLGCVELDFFLALAFDGANGENVLQVGG